MDDLEGVTIVKDDAANRLLINLLHDVYDNPVIAEILGGNGEIIQKYHLQTGAISILLNDFKKGNFSVRVTINNNVYVKKI